MKRPLASAVLAIVLAAPSCASPPVPAPSTATPAPVRASASPSASAVTPSPLPTAEPIPPPPPAREESAEPPRDPAVEAVVVAAVGKNADVQAVCRLSKQRGGPCLVDVTEAGRGACPPGPPTLHRCLWSIGLLAHMGTHASRLATVLVRPDGTLVGAAPIDCGPMAFADWARRERASRGGQVEVPCPPELPLGPPDP